MNNLQQYTHIFVFIKWSRYSHSTCERVDVANIEYTHSLQVFNHVARGSEWVNLTFNWTLLVIARETTYRYIQLEEESPSQWKWHLKNALQSVLTADCDMRWMYIMFKTLFLFFRIYVTFAKALRLDDDECV